MSLSGAYNHNLQQLYIDSSQTNVPDNFMISVSVHGGLVHVVMMIRSLTAKGITCMVRNSPNMITLCCEICERATVERCNTTLKNIFKNRAQFTAGHYEIAEYLDYDHVQNVLYEQGTDLFSPWPDKWYI